jgi:hypothetical protein
MFHCIYSCPFYSCGSSFIVKITQKCRLKYSTVTFATKCLKPDHELEEAYHASMKLCLSWGFGLGRAVNFIPPTILVQYFTTDMSILIMVYQKCHTAFGDNWIWMTSQGHHTFPHLSMFLSSQTPPKSEVTRDNPTD